MPLRTIIDQVGHFQHPSIGPANEIESSYGILALPFAKRVHYLADFRGLPSLGAFS